MDQEIEVYSAPFEYTLSIIGGKWKMVILFWLSKRNIMRYGEFKKNITGITHKMLSAQLKELEANDIIVRKEYHQVPPKVEYFLSKKGLSLMPILEQICSWGYLHFEDTVIKDQ